MMCILMKMTLLNSKIPSRIPLLFSHFGNVMTKIRSEPKLVLTIAIPNWLQIIRDHVDSSLLKARKIMVLIMTHLIARRNLNSDMCSPRNTS